MADFWHDPMIADPGDPDTARRAALSPILGGDDVLPSSSSVRVNIGARSHQGTLRHAMKITISSCAWDASK